MLFMNVSIEAYVCIPHCVEFCHGRVLFGQTHRLGDTIPYYNR